MCVCVSVCVCVCVCVSSGRQGYDQKRKLFRTSSFVLAHSSAKKFYIEQLIAKSSTQWYHMTLI